jgi:two-component system, NtrC family, sensor kinase
MSDGNYQNSDLAAEAITLRIRWFGLGIGCVLVNFLPREINQFRLNLLLALGAIYALLDTVWSYRGQVFLNRVPLAISLMEAIFIGMLCFFDIGLESPFRFYYYLSLLVFAFRYSPTLTYATLALHSVSYIILAFTLKMNVEIDWTSFIMNLVLMGWVTWAGIALAGLVKSASKNLAELNEQLKQNQALLEHRIEERTHELQQSQALLVQQEKQAAFGLLAAGIAHEVGNPLAAISSLVQMMNIRLKDDYTKEQLQLVDDQLLRIQRTLRELVDFSRPVMMEYSLVNMNDVLEVALNIAKYYKRRKGKNVETHFAKNLPSIRSVRDLLVQVFLNLILNALDATEEGDSIVITTDIVENRIRIQIRDYGHGIKEEDHESIFKPYFTTKETGTGLGLFVCKNIIQKFDGGEMELTESSSGGTLFTVLLGIDSSTNSSESSLKLDHTNQSAISRKPH